MNKIIITYSSFVISCLVVILAFITATTYIQLAVAILLYPLLVFFTYKILPQKLKHSSKRTTSQPTMKAEIATDTLTRNIGISDIDKRVFLKLIGSAGVFLFLFSLFNKKSEGLFFKSLPGTVTGMVTLQDAAGNKINPAQTQPFDGYKITEIDDNVVSFYGFTNKDGYWYVMKVDTNTGSFRYATGQSNFPGNWQDREKLRYGYFSESFK
jgi:hypothetical protein